MIRQIPFYCLLLLSFPLIGGSPHPTEPRDYIAPDMPPSTFMYSVSIEKLQRKFTRPFPLWMKKRIEGELSPFNEQKITRRALDATYDHLTRVYPFTRYRFIGQHIYRLGPDPYGMDQFYRTLGRLAEYPGIPDLPYVDFIVNQSDGIPIEYDPPNFWITPNPADQAPIFAYARRNDAPYVISMPDRFTIPTWFKVVEEVLANSSAIPWKKKIKAVNWRGQTTDFCRHGIGSYSMEEVAAHYSQKPRYQICALSLQCPDLINAGFNAVHDGASNLHSFVRPMMKPGLGYADQIRYAYLPVLDGYTSTYPGFLWRLLSSSVAMKQESPNSQWFYDALQPYVHYIPISEHMEDLFEKIHWAQGHDNECRKIAENAQAFVLKNLMTEDLYLYQFLILQEYAKRQDFSTQFLEDETRMNPSWVRIR